ncbi:hypothetical protein [Companilactobacillus pabuli]|uniref:hypothetical protein n=1 Tax=Companilactobacillus pabuli TaxID=2714036 RepID=UPI0024168A86|nr:hypothetical protein [Companilactobacillus pabuli]MDG5112770.1 hypothetical protein [Companilactobacillus pabuli]
MNDVRILKGYSKNQQKELEYARKNMSCNDFLHNITYFPAPIECDSIKDKYDEADTDERISIIRDILDFYTDKAKFLEQKYVLETTTPQSLAHTYIKGISRSTYAGIGAADEIKTTSNKEEALVLSKNTIVQKLGGKYMAFAVPVEDDNE